MDGLLTGMRVLDLSIWRPGPYATQLLAELGAEVIKVEPPGGDPMRVYPALFAGLHAGKRSVVLDLKRDADRTRALALAAEADVVIEGYRPGVADRLGVGYPDVRAVNPRVIYCSLSGFGQTGPLAGVSGHDLNYQAWAGALAPDGGDPQEGALPVADLAGGMAAALAVTAAYARQGRTGEGERIDIGMADVLATWTGAAAPTAEGADPSLRGVPGYGTFATGDGWITLGVLNEQHFWHGLCTTLGMHDVEDVDFPARLARIEELQARLRDRIAERSRDELVAALLAVGVPVAPVLSRAEMVDLPHFRERGSVTAEPWQQLASGFPFRLALHPPGRTGPPPALDEHAGTTFTTRP